MKKRTPSRVSEREMAVLQLLWKGGPLTAREICDALYPKGGQTEFAAVHSFLQRLERKRVIERDRSGFVHVFSALVSKEDFVGSELDALANRLSGGSLAPLILNLVERQQLSADDADKIQRMLEKYLREKRGLK